MTTTLRPAGPERREADGGRARDFTVCVNGRPVGTVRLAAEAGGEPGRIEELAIDPPDRRRGRGTVAALAAEEVLRQWGCRRVVVSVPEAEELLHEPEPRPVPAPPGAVRRGPRKGPPPAPYGLRIALSLGYTETNRTLHKDLPSGAGDLPAGPPSGARLREVALTEGEEWLARQRAGFVTALTTAGVPAAQAEAHALTSYAAALPHSTLLVLDADGATAGRLWLTATRPSGWVQAVEVDPAHRARGFGRALMLAAERACRAAGVTGLGLNVFTTNAVALGLYDSLGYRVRMRQLWKSLV